MQRYQTAIFDNARWEGFVHRPTDIFICTPPKCGTTWTQTIVVNLLFPDGNPPAPVMMLSPWIDAKMMMPHKDMLAMLEAQTHRRVIKTHTPADGIPWFDDAKYIVVCRDGRDAFMSMVNHVERLKHVDALNEQALQDGIPTMPEYSGDLHEMFEWWLEDDVLFFGFMQSYWARHDQPNVLFVHFNDLKQDLAGQMQRIAAFLEIEISPDQWPAVVERSTFEYMRNHEELVGDMSIAFEGGTKGFLFKGTNGRWRDVLTNDELNAYQQRLSSTLPPDAVQWIARD